MSTLSPVTLRPHLAAVEYFRRACLQYGPEICPRCRSPLLYRLGTGRRRCKRCRYTFSEFCGRWLSQSRLTAGEWLTVLQMFESEASVDDIASTLGRAYATAYHAVTVLRAGILAHDISGHLVLRDNPRALHEICCHRGHTLLKIDGHAPVFGIRDEAGVVSVPALPDIAPDFVLRLPVKKVRRGNLVHTGHVVIYDALVFALLDVGQCTSQVRFASSPTYIDRASGFWSYATPRLAAHHGISAGHFPLYLKEVEFRYNHRHRPLAPILTEYLCDFVPWLDS